MPLTLDGDKGEEKGARVAPCANADVHELVGETLHGPSVDKGMLDEPETEIERNERIHGGQTEKGVWTHLHIDIGMALGLLDDKNKKLPFSMEHVNRRNDVQPLVHDHANGRAELAAKKVRILGRHRAIENKRPLTGKKVRQREFPRGQCLIIEGDKVPAGKDALMLNEIAKHELDLGGGKRMGRLRTATGHLPNGYKLIEQHEPLKHLLPATHLSARPTELQIHQHAQRIGVDVVDSLDSGCLLREHPINGRVNGSDVGNGNVVDIHLNGPLVHSLSRRDIGESGAKQVAGQMLHVEILVGREEIVIGNGILWVVELVLGGQIGVDGLASVANAAFFRKKGLDNVDGVQGFLVMGGFIVDSLFGLRRRLFDEHELAGQGFVGKEFGGEVLDFGLHSLYCT